MVEGRLLQGCCVELAVIVRIIGILVIVIIKIIVIVIVIIVIIVITIVIIIVVLPLHRKGNRASQSEELSADHILLLSLVLHKKMRPSLVPKPKKTTQFSFTRSIAQFPFQLPLCFPFDSSLLGLISLNHYTSCNYFNPKP